MILLLLLCLLNVGFISILACFKRKKRPVEAKTQPSSAVHSSPSLPVFSFFKHSFRAIQFRALGRVTLYVVTQDSTVHMNLRFSSEYDDQNTVIMLWSCEAVHFTIFAW
ncbi:hypothetical protein Y032_0014g2432 [Ancylostoma ceylanicum]|uniref:Uncharacterized protein n=1 Tax=Ancylostoma ceylanicum TaxID=53326 RepID=A0A016VAK4_9BILA|nr:hypothetical protein Y032_0014g2432 [Ancylostoma ceylanicum]